MRRRELILDPEATNPPLLEHVRKGLAETGYREGQNVELRYAGAAGRYDRLPTLAAGLVSEGANVVIAISPPPRSAPRRMRRRRPRSSLCSETTR